MAWTPPDAHDRVTPHLTWGELTVRDRVPGARLASLTEAGAIALRRVAAVVEVIRAEAGGRPIRVTSGWRGPATHPGSQHEVGQAMDIQIDGMTPLDLARLIRTRRALMPHPLRQVIAETLALSSSALALPMGEGSGQWVHVAVLGVGAEPWTRPTQSAWLRSWRVDGRATYAPMEAA